MKKFFLSLLLAVMAVGANAQVTYNFRVGGGIGSDEQGHDIGVVTAQIQSNIPFTKGSPLTFSPSVVLSTNFDESYHLYAPLTVGYKIPMNVTSRFFPKVGLALGVEADEGDMIVGPTVGLDFEISHFVIGVNGYYSVVGPTDEDDGYYYKHYEYESSNHHGINLTVGYKF